MSKVAISEEYLTDIADSIREKLGSQDTYKVSEMSEAIDSITGGGGDIDWSAIGYSSAPQAINEAYNYAKTIYDNWENVTDLTNRFKEDIDLVIMPLVNTSNLVYASNLFNNCVCLINVPLLNTSNLINATSMFSGCTSLKKVPLFDTRNVTSMLSMFSGCTNLGSVPLFSTNNVTSMRYMFQNCASLTTIPLFDTSSINSSASLQSMLLGVSNLDDTSLDNVLQMCINATNYTGIKTLARLGCNRVSYPTDRIQALPHYQDFINAGWTIGY